MARGGGVYSYVVVWLKSVGYVVEGTNIADSQCLLCFVSGWKGADPGSGWEVLCFRKQKPLLVNRSFLVRRSRLNFALLKQAAVRVARGLDSTVWELSIRLEMLQDCKVAG